MALISVSNKTNLETITKHLETTNRMIYSTGGTFDYIKNVIGIKLINEVKSITKFPEILNGRVKTLHPNIYGGILADRSSTTHTSELYTHGINYIDLVIVNLYNFGNTIRDLPLITDQTQKSNNEKLAIESIDIGGVSLIRAAAKNYAYVVVLTDPSDYMEYIRRDINNNVTIEYRKSLAVKAFKLTSEYDKLISNYFDDTNTITLRYGCNPHQSFSYLTNNNSLLPLKVLSGKPSYINILDAMNGWQLVKEIRLTTNLFAVASYKHTSPAGVGVSGVHYDQLSYMFANDSHQNLSGLAIAFIKARSCDPLSSFGDFIACSHQVDASTADLIKREISDGIIAPGYTSEALDILQSKKNGSYLILEIDFNYNPPSTIEHRDVYGLTLVQTPNHKIVNHTNIVNGIVTKNKTLSDDIILDMLIANTTLKYTQSNSIAIAHMGKVIGIGAGQQNRIDCVKIACKKANLHNLLLTEKYSNIWKQLTGKRQEKINQLYDLANNDTTIVNQAQLVLASDGFFPFDDSIHYANNNNIKYIVQPGGSSADGQVIKTCDQYNMVMSCTGVRLFTH